MTYNRIDGGFGFPLGFAAAIVVTVLSVAAGATAHHGYSLVALVVVTTGVSLVTPMRAAVGVAAAAWALHAGFVLGRLGELVFTTESVRSGMLLVAVAVAGSGLGSLGAQHFPVRMSAVNARPGHSITKAR
jgi:high-affinity nickel permease